jgi:hypothetical protein
MNLPMKTFRSISFSVMIAGSVTLAPENVFAEVVCSGHEALSSPRPEASCLNVPPEIFESPDKKLRAVVFPVDISLDTTPDMESRVVIRASDGNTLTSKDYSSPRGMNGYYVDRGQWSPDSQFFVYSLVSSGGHSPWSFPIMVYSRQKNATAKFSDMINGNPTLSGEFLFAGPHVLSAVTWKKPGALDEQVPIKVDLEAAFKKLTPSQTD